MGHGNGRERIYLWAMVFEILRPNRSFSEDADMNGKQKMSLRLAAVAVVVISILPSCSKKRKATYVVPGRSIAGVNLDMSEQQVLAILGQPTSQYDMESMAKLGAVHDIDRTGKYERVPSKEMKGIKVLAYEQPPLAVTIDENSQVVRLSISYCEDISVKGYPFLRFVYLNEDELERIGQPTHVARMKASEEKLTSMAPEGTELEFYEHSYDTLGMNLGLIFDRTVEATGAKGFIGVNHIDVYAPGGGGR